MKELTPEEVESMNRLRALASEFMCIIEGLRPGGGFKELIDPKYCKCCGKELND
jgi:hypothetical protein